MHTHAYAHTHTHTHTLTYKRIRFVLHRDKESLVSLFLSLSLSPSLPPSLWVAKMTPGEGKEEGYERRDSDHGKGG